ncbi:ABC transporter permease [Acuticoccus kandeliae]|uniref:ABC transporter permease n=1 Tax=Acuticoccus kandeliae TaxID=2073160 RepID=UPI000D3EA2FB|nr:ABC transporter permease [Acuticoccus kandeliae]
MDFITGFWNLVPVTLAQSLVYGFIALGIMIPFRLLNFPDLTCEGAFPLGGCLCAALLVAGVPPGLAFLLAIAAGFLAGCATALIHLNLKINTLLAGILMITMLWSLNLRIMGKSNTPLFTETTFFDSLLPTFTRSLIVQNSVWVPIVIGVCALVSWYLHTDSGLALRASGASSAMARANGVYTWRMTLLGVGVANAFSAFAGASVAQVQGYADVAMGFGVLINGLAALIIGEAIVGRSSVLRQVAAPFVGSLVYYQVISAGLAAGVNPSDLKLVTGLFVLGMLALSSRRGGLRAERRINA